MVHSGARRDGTFDPGADRVVYTHPGDRGPVRSAVEAGTAGPEAEDEARGVIASPSSRAARRMRA
jgi:hypothetical protein